ncbi:hypothetical protein H5999_09995 [[Clostridium] spiroforme]|nr:hypothetical protein [Thomasclavelia spiroformis]
MYINTKSKESIQKSLCNVLNINKETLYEIINECYNIFHKNHQIFILDDQYEFFFKYVKEHQKETIDHIMFIHLARRFKKDQDNNGYDFINTLTQKTSLSKFLKKYGITFQYDKRINMYANGKEINLDDENDSYSCYYLKNRFGYQYKDFNFKGYMFADNIEQSEVYELHEEGPEFFGYLFLFTDDRLIDDFYEQSDYYKFEYLVPIDMINFEDDNIISNVEKQRHIIVSCLQRLYNYVYDPNMNLYENKVMYIEDDKALSDSFLINKVKI